MRLSSQEAKKLEEFVHHFVQKQCKQSIFDKLKSFFGLSFTE